MAAHPPTRERHMAATAATQDRMMTWLLVSAAVTRILLIAFGQWQDATLAVKYTDVDYLVFSDAAGFVWEGKSPFERVTYRYSPLLAYALIPNVVVSQLWGKLLFSAAELLVAHQLRLLLLLQGVSSTQSLPLVATWLFNPLTATVATRGNCEALVCAMLLHILLCLTRGRVIEAAVWYGVIVHVRIYPVIFALSMLLFLRRGRRDGGSSGSHGRSSSGSSEQSYFWFLNGEKLRFGIISGSVFLSLTIVFYVLYGARFLNEALLYHLTRVDHRHNFSVYFYQIYLSSSAAPSVWMRLESFLPQLLIQLLSSLKLADHLPLCLFLQTFAFVAFNKVITAQYFVWFFCLLPLVVPSSRLTLKQWALCGATWMFFQLHWLSWAYRLEFEGENVFLMLWFASIAFFAVNVFMMACVIVSHKFEQPYPLASHKVKDSRTLQ